MRKDVSTRGDFDVIVIGSGVGGLTTAALLARCRGKRVLVLERHYRAGGFTHTFSRPGGFTWDVGVHYIGAEVLAPGYPRDALQVATDGALVWTRLSERFERLYFPGFEYSIHAGRDRFVSDLVSAFPAEERAIHRWVADVERVAKVSEDVIVRALAPAPVSWVLSLLHARDWRLATTRTRDYLERNFGDPRLRAILGARWGDYGLPPSESAFLAHAIISRHYFEGAVYPSGSSAAIGESMIKTLSSAGGEVRVKAEVDQILVRQGRAVGVRLKDGQEIAAPWVVSDAGAHNTYLRLVPEEVPLPFRDDLRRVPKISALVLYLGLSRSPAELGVGSENHWFYDDLDHDALWADSSRAVEGDVRAGYLSFPSMKDPSARAHTAEVITLVDPTRFERFRGTAWKKRGAEYEALKSRIADALLKRAEKSVPGLSALVRYQELSTPLSSEHFTAHPGGQIYGVPWTPERARMSWLSARTPLRGLCLAGADAGSFGVTGAVMGGVAAAARIAGSGLMRELSQRAGALSAPAVFEPTGAEPSPSIA